MDNEEIYALTHLSMHPIWAKVDDKLLMPLLQQFDQEDSSIGVQYQKDEGERESSSARLMSFFERVIEKELNHIYYLRKRRERFVRAYAQSVSVKEQHQHILNYAKDLGATEAELKKDEAAFSRWFDESAMHDRYTRRISFSEQKIVLCLQRLGPLIVHMLETEDHQFGYRELWLKFNLEKSIKPLFDFDGDDRVLIAAFRCLTQGLQGLPKSEQEKVIESSTLQFIYRTALEKNKNLWIQYEALCLLQTLSFESFLISLKKCLQQAEHKDDFFLRRRVVFLLVHNIAHCPDLEELLSTIVNDPSPYVRQALAQNLDKLTKVSFIQWLPQIALQDDSTQVRAAALLSVIQILNNRYLFPSILEVMGLTLQNNMDKFILRVAFKTIVDGYRVLVKSSPDLAEKWLTTLIPLLDQIHTHSIALNVRRWAAETNEKLWCESVPEAKELWEKLNKIVTTMRKGERVKLPKDLLRKYDKALIGRVMAVMTQNDFGLTISERTRGTLTRGIVFRFKLWRLLYELRNPSPDKRQGFPHTIGRIVKGQIRAPSAILAELAETKVPGEPLFISSEGGYRPYLPLMDDILSCLNHPGSDIKIYTSEGVTTVQASRNILSRLKARWQINFKFAHYAYLRNWLEDSQLNPNNYIHALRKLGFSISFKPYDKKPADPAVTRFFSGFGILSLSEQWEQLKDYFFSVYQNTLSDLTFFVLIAIILFLANQFYVNKKLRKARRALPLVIGGWGTRGKSGTERLKVAMFNALGYSIVSKTSGCEAMFLLAHPFGKTYDLLLFRPYDKATIWEQANLMEFARKFNADVFLWECMALRPAYVNLMQHQWVQDDISTITNTFPDHEDIQGPAGINVAEVIAKFIPKAQNLITTEEEMLPILRDTCDELKTELLEVNWLDTGLLTHDVLARFPYDEHPSNIALVTKLGEKLGIESDFALKEMADRIVPDLGVLKTYPTAHINSRQLVFVNGMSANERYASLGNWIRMHFDTQNPYQDPSIWISTIVNNRADRAARSQVFASILVKDLSADKHFLIGTNLHGLMGYIQEAWNQFAQDIELWPESKSATNDNVEKVLIQFAKRYRISFLQDQVIARLRAMLIGAGLTDSVDDLLSLWSSPDELSKRLSITNLNELSHDIIENHSRNLEELSEYQEFLAVAKRTEMSQRENINNRFRSLLERWFMRKIYVIEDADATGNQIINHIVCKTPPGYKNRMMGMQNIKGTGLDFVYQWRAWNICYQACEKLRQKESALIEQGLSELGLFQDFNLLCEKYVKDSLSEVQNKPVAQQEWFQAEIKRILSNLDLAIKNIKEEINAPRDAGWLEQIYKGVKSILDIDKGIKRRKKADRIYEDLLSERISIQRAIIELQTLNNAQR